MLEEYTKTHLRPYVGQKCCRTPSEREHNWKGGDGNGKGREGEGEGGTGKTREGGNGKRKQEEEGEVPVLGTSAPPL